MQNYRYIAVSIAAISALTAWLMYKPVPETAPGTTETQSVIEPFDEAKYLNNKGVGFARERNLAQSLELLNLGHTKFPKNKVIKKNLLALLYYDAATTVGNNDNYQTRLEALETLRCAESIAPLENLAEQLKKTIEYEHGINGWATSIKGIDIHTDLPKNYISDFERNIKKDIRISHPAVDGTARCGFSVLENGAIDMPMFVMPAGMSGIAKIRCDQLNDACMSIINQNRLPALPEGTKKINVEVNFAYKAETKKLDLVINTNLFYPLVKDFNKRLELIP